MPQKSPHAAQAAPSAAEARAGDLRDGAGLVLCGTGHHDDVIDQAGKEARAWIAVQIDSGHDHHVEAFRLRECLFDIRFADPPVAPAARRNERHHVDIGRVIANDHVAQIAASDGDVDKPGVALIAIDRRKGPLLEIGVDQQHLLRRGGDCGEHERNRNGIILVVGGDD